MLFHGLERRNLLPPLASYLSLISFCSGVKSLLKNKAWKQALAFQDDHLLMVLLHQDTQMLSDFLLIISRYCYMRTGVREKKWMSFVPG